MDTKTKMQVSPGDRFATRVRLYALMGEKPGAEDTDDVIFPDSEEGVTLGLAKGGRLFAYEVYRVGERHVWIGHKGYGLSLRPLRRLGLAQFRRLFSDAVRLEPWRGLEAVVNGKRVLL